VIRRWWLSYGSCWLSGRQVLCEHQLKRRSGELIWVEMGGNCLRPEDPDAGVIWTFLDITERRKSQSRVAE
jgi:hypothetical protein